MNIASLFMRAILVSVACTLPALAGPSSADLVAAERNASEWMVYGHTPTTTSASVR